MESVRSRLVRYMELALVKSEVVKTVRKKGIGLGSCYLHRCLGSWQKTGKVYHWEGDMTYEVELYDYGEDSSYQHLWNWMFDPEVEITSFCKTLHTSWFDCPSFEPDGRCPRPASMVPSQYLWLYNFPRFCESDCLLPIFKLPLVPLGVWLLKEFPDQWQVKLPFLR